MVNPSTAMARVLVDEMVRQGVRDVVLSPGSRSGPLALAVADADARGHLRLHVRIDERSAGFLAVGLAMVSGTATAVITTSGTAVSNLTPAIVEASYAGIPLLIITADRPPEMRATGANQTIEQTQAFAALTRYAHDLGTAERRDGLVAYWRSVVDRAIDTAVEVMDPGPVHLNVPFREPLVPDAPYADDDWPEPLGLMDAEGDNSDAMPHAIDARLTLTAAQPLDEVLAPVVELTDDDEDTDDVVPSRGVVIVGHLSDLQQADAAIALAEACGWPLIAEPTGNARSGDTTLAHGPLLLADEDWALAHVPDVVIVVGAIGLSRSVMQLVRRTPTVVSVDPRGARSRPDPTRTTTVHLAVVPEPPDDYDAYDDSWLDAWLAADALAKSAVERTLDATDTLTGPDVARTLWDLAGPDNLLLAAASWPVRHLESFARVRETEDAPYVVGNRGTSGIDGLVSTTWGAALSHQGETTVVVEDSDGGLEVVSARGGTAYALLGDLAFLHDHNGFVVGPDEPRPDVVYVVVDNNGGGIFGQLEQAGVPHFERVFGTPHGLDLAAVARGVGIHAVTVTDVSGLVHAIDEATAMGGVHVVVAKVGERAAEAALLTTIGIAVSAALREAIT